MPCHPETLLNEPCGFCLPRSPCLLTRILAQPASTPTSAAAVSRPFPPHFLSCCPLCVWEEAQAQSKQRQCFRNKSGLQSIFSSCRVCPINSACCALLRLVAQSCLTLLDPMDCSPPGSSVHGDSAGKNTRVGCHVLHQGIFPMQGSNPGLPHCRRILYQLSYQGSPRLSIPKSRRAKATDLAWFPVVGPGPGLTSQGANITHQPVLPS